MVAKPRQHLQAAKVRPVEQVVVWVFGLTSTDHTAPARGTTDYADLTTS